MPEFTLVHYLALDGRTPFGSWFQTLGHIEAAKVIVALDRLAAGNFSKVKPVGAGVLELRIHFGPGYRVYLGRDGNRIVVLLGGGTKQRQERDIAAAKHAWRDYWSRRSRMEPTEE
jgi:putative addiction module killer protein